MNWEPMTEEAVFLDYDDVLIYIPESDTYHVTVFKEGKFRDGVYWFAEREDITHFCRITNPNEETP